jgi:hypothetical protein
MSIGWVILLILAVFAVIIANITLLRDSKDFRLPDSYLERKKAEEAYLKAQAEQNEAGQKHSASDSSDTAKKAANEDADKPSGFF